MLAAVEVIGQIEAIIHGDAVPRRAGSNCGKRGLTI